MFTLPSRDPSYGTTLDMLLSLYIIYLDLGTNDNIHWCWCKNEDTQHVSEDVKFMFVCKIFFEDLT